MSGTIKPFIDFSVGTNGDTGEDNADSILPVENGEQLTAAVTQRPSESLRQRTEELRSNATDSLFLQNADRQLIIAGPGKVTWAGSTTVAADGKVVLTDTLWILPMLSPGNAQTPPIPPVASAFGVLHLQRDDSVNTISVTSRRRSYAGGDQINVTVAAGSPFACVLESENGFQRTIKITAVTGVTTLGTTITALNALLPTAPDNTQLVTAALEGGGSNSDLLLDTQAKQYVLGNYEGEGHSLTPANLASFFTSNPTQALAEGDTLCVAYEMLYDTASNGGRRQSIPENSNTTVPAGAFFNSRVHPENLVNALPICKVVNGRLAFSTGIEVPAGSTGFDLAGQAAASIAYGGGAAWADGTTNPATTVEGQLDKILVDLGGAGGASKIKYDGGGTWADTSTNPATTVEAQLDKVISDLAGAAGSAKIQGVVVGSDLAAGTLQAQIADLAANWLKMGRANTITAAQTFSALITATAGLTANAVITATAGLTAGVNQNVTLSGTGHVKHGNYTRTIPILFELSRSGGVVTRVDNLPGMTIDTGVEVYYAIPVNNHYEQLESITIHSVASADTTNYYLATQTGVNTNTFTNVTGASAASASSNVTLTPTTPALLTDGLVYWLGMLTNTAPRTMLTLELVYSVP